MKNELVLAMRSLLRNRRRSLATLLALAIGLTSIVLFGGFKTNIRYSMLTAYVRTGGHLQIQNRDFFLFGSGNPTAYSIYRYEELMAAIRDDPELKRLVTVVTPKLQLSGVAGNFDAGVSHTVLGTGFVPEDVNRMRLWNEYSVPFLHPPFLLEGASDDGAIVGVGVARVLQLCEALKVPNCTRPSVQQAPPAPAPERPGKVAKPDNSKKLSADILALSKADAANSRPAALKGGARVELLASSGRGAPNVAALTVLAAVDQGFKELDEVSVILQLPYAQRLVFGRTAPRVTAIMVQLRNSSDLSRVARRLEQLLREKAPDQSLVVRDFQELNPYYVQSIELFDFIFGFIFVLIAGIVLFTVSNTMNAAVIERTVEVGTLRSIGLRRSGIQRMFVLEGLLIGCAGAVTGVVIALLLAEVINHSGLTWLPPTSSERLPLQLRVLGENATMVGAAIGLVLIATLSAWWPAWRAAQLKIVEALRHV